MMMLSLPAPTAAAAAVEMIVNDASVVVVAAAVVVALTIDKIVVAVDEVDSRPFVLHSHIHIVSYSRVGRIDRQHRIATNVETN